MFWGDGTKTVVKCQPGDIYDPEKGLAMAISKKALGNQGNYCNVFKKWVPEEKPLDIAFELKTTPEGNALGAYIQEAVYKILHSGRESEIR